MNKIAYLSLLSILAGCAVEGEIPGCDIACGTESVLIDTRKVCEEREVTLYEESCIIMELLVGTTECVKEEHCQQVSVEYTSSECEVTDSELTGTVCGIHDFTYLSLDCNTEESTNFVEVCSDRGCTHDHGRCNNGSGNGPEGCSPSENGNDDESGYDEYHSTNFPHNHEHQEESCLEYEFSCQDTTCEEVEYQDSIEVCLDYNYVVQTAKNSNSMLTATTEHCFEEEDCFKTYQIDIRETCEMVEVSKLIEVCWEEKTYKDVTFCDDSRCKPDNEWLQGGNFAGLN